MLENKLIKASQAILKNTTLIVCSGSGMTADCQLGGSDSPSWEGNHIPVFRGTFGLWREYPAFRKQLILFEELVQESFFKQYPHKFWFVYGDLLNKINRAKPHQGYEALKNILDVAGKKEKSWVYHAGVDNMYQKSGFDMQKFSQAKGCLLDWQCKKCNKLYENMGLKAKFDLDRINGLTQKIPLCKVCSAVLRPNINLRDDFDWIETKSLNQLQNMQRFFQRPDISKHSVTVLEIGAGPVQPLAREYAEIFLKNDKYRCALIRINPVKERTSQFNYERNQFEELVAKHRIVQADGSYKIEQEVKQSHVPDCLKDDFKHLIIEEERTYLNLKNELIEIQLNAAEALPLLLQNVLKQKQALSLRKPN